MSATGGAGLGARNVGTTTLGREKQRSRTGCQTCRSRKVKCDERAGGCRTCERLEIHCSNSPDQPSVPAYPTPPEAGDEDTDGESLKTTQAGHRRRRTYRSCNACRSSKSRCSAEQPSCSRCRLRSVECVYKGRPVPAWMEAQNSGLSSQNVASDGTPQSFTSSSYAGSDGDLSPGLPRRGSTGHRPVAQSGLRWLLAPELPGKERVTLLLTEYFNNVHSLRSFGFIHKPTFMLQLDERLGAQQRKKDVLLYTLCALGAKFYASRCADSTHLAEGFALYAGSQWAEKAQYLLFTSLNNVAVEKTMAIVLLHEHALRVGSYAAAFSLTGLAVRMAQALQINLESSSDILCLDNKGLTASSREARRRLAWSVWILDSWVGSGVDELTLLHDRDLKIQLPCNERSFLLQTPCIVETLQPGTLLPYLTPETQAQGPMDTVVDLQAQFIRLICLRKQVLRYVKHLDRAKMPWLLDSEFAMLETALIRWHQVLPASLKFSQPAIYMRKESSQLGGLLLLHITYHQTLTDLNRIGMPDLYKIRVTMEFPPEKLEFAARAQDQCADHCLAISAIMDEALRHGPETLSDTWLPVVAHDAIRVIVHYTINGLGCLVEKVPKQAVYSSLHSLLRALKEMTPTHSLAKALHLSSIAMLNRGGLTIPAELDLNPAPGAEVEWQPEMQLRHPAQCSPDYVLNPLAIYRMARKEIHEEEKHAPEDSPTTTAAPTDIFPCSEPMHLSGTLLAINDGVGSFTDDDLRVEFPASFDDLQTYLPLMLGNYSLPGQPGGGAAPFGEAGQFAGFDQPRAGAVPVSVYPPLPGSEAGSVAPLDVPMTAAPAAFGGMEQPTWSSE